MPQTGSLLVRAELQHSDVAPIIDSYLSERQEMPLVGGYGCLELVLYGIRELA